VIATPDCPDNCHGAESKNGMSAPTVSRDTWYDACVRTADDIATRVPEYYRSRTFSGIIGDIKALPARKALSLISRKKGLGDQYSSRYLADGIDRGYGYQACALEAFDSILGPDRSDIVRGRILDVGCAVGVTAGVLGLSDVTGFDLFIDLLHAARQVDTLTGAHNRYIVADMTRPWPLSLCFDTVFCGLVCHHLKTQHEIVSFFSEANRVCIPGGRIVVTLPAGSVSSPRHLSDLVDGLGTFGFDINPDKSGLVMSRNVESSVFWVFVLVAEKSDDYREGPFVSPDFAFPAIRTPVSRVEKGARARSSIRSRRDIRHSDFRLIPLSGLGTLDPDISLTYRTVRDIATD
jgi:SAM-dependent methyltransferase